MAPSDRLLEIGCGHGVAVSLICARLSTGSVVAIDRSSSILDQATRRNREHVDDGKAVFRAVALADADLGVHRFDKIFAINVRLFRKEPARDAEVLNRALKPSGALYLFQQHPSAERTRAVTQELEIGLERNGFAVREVKQKGTGASTMSCIVTKPRH